MTVSKNVSKLRHIPATGTYPASFRHAKNIGVFAIRQLRGILYSRFSGWGIQWAPDGLKAAYIRDGRFVIYDFIGDTKTEIKTERPWPYVHIYWNSIWSSDSKRICFLGTRANGKIEVGILNLAGGQPTFRVRADGSEFLQDIAWNSRGDQIAMPTRSAPGKPGQILVFDPDGYRPPHRLANQPADQVNGGMCWTRDGGTLIFLTRR